MKAETGFFGEMKGTGKVFRFTLEETFKTRMNQVTLVIMLVLALFCVPLGSLMLGDAAYETEEASDETDITEYQSDNYGNMTDAQLDYLKTQGISDVTIDALKKYADGTTWDSVEEYEEYLSWLAEDDAAVSEEEDYSDIDTSLQTMTIQLIYAVLVMMLCLLATSYIIRIVLEEKTSKLVDLLMVSCRPMALLMGKILAMLVYVLCMLVLVVAGAVVSYKIFGTSVDTAYIDTISPEGVSFTLQVVKVFFAMGISAVLGYVGFGFLAGVLGAGCNNMDESGNAMSVPMLMVMGGYFIALLTSMSANHVLQTILSFIPVLNMYVAPVQYIAGNIGLPVLLMSWVVQILWAMSGLWLSSRVYASLIINNGRQVKFREILKMARKGVA